jgi:hypothetical protein
MKTSNISDLYQNYRRRIDVRQVLEHYGAEHCHEIVSSDGTTEIVHSCLLDKIEPHHKNADRNPSAWANVEKGLYVCSVWWAGDILHLIQKLEGKDDFGSIMPVVSGFLVGATKDAASLRQELDQLFSEEIYSVDLPSYSERVLDSWRSSHPYMREWRGISHETQELLGIGYDEKENRVVFPHWWDGRLVGWQKRVIPNTRRNHQTERWEVAKWPPTYPDWPRYRNSSALPKSETLYAYDMIQKEHIRDIVVVESPMSVAKAYTHNIPGVLATFGAKVSRAQIRLLREFPRVIVWFDADPAGMQGAYRLVQGLYRHIEVLVVEPDEGIDLGDLNSADEVREKLNGAMAAPLWLAKHDAGRFL